MPPPTDVFVLPALRSPFTKADREHGSLDALQLSVPVVQQSVVGGRGLGPDRASEVDLFVWGAVIPTLALSNWGREVWLETGLDPHVPSVTVIQQCGTSLAGAMHAAGQVLSGSTHLALCGGVDSLSSAQIGLSRELSRTIRRATAAKGFGGVLEQLRKVRWGDVRLSIPAVKERTTGLSMGQHCEVTARRWSIGREEQDDVAAASHREAVRAAGDGFYRALLVAPGSFPADADTLPRADSTIERLARLKPVFDRETGTLTAGNSSPLTDGAASVWVADGDGADRLPSGLPRVRLLDWEQAAVDIEIEGLLMAPALAIPRLLARNDRGYTDVALWEIHEAFAAQVLSTVAALENETWLGERAGVDVDLGPFPRDRVNPNGGSIALGHPFGATGARILSQAAVELAELPAGSLGVVSICAAGGLGHVALLEAV
jgi:acetyl-CoA C-acetyltransferase